MTGRLEAGWTVPQGIPWRLVRMSVALAIAAGSFVALRELYYSSCIVPFHDWLGLLGFFGLPVVFLPAVLWFGAEGLRALTAASLSRPTPWVASIAVSAAVYLAVAGVTWGLDPTPKQPLGDFPYRGFMSLFWSVGFLMETGNFDEYACGQ